MLAIAALIGIVAAAISFVALKESAPTQTTYARREVLVVKADLLPRQVINLERDLEVVSIPSSGEYEGMARRVVKADERESLRGVRVARHIPAGSFLTYGDIAELSRLEFGAERGDTRAVSLGVSDKTGLLGILVPGDMVDLWVSLPQPDEPSNPPPSGAGGEAAVYAMLGQRLAASFANSQRWISTPVLEYPVRVLATGSRFSGTRAQFDLASDQGDGDWRVITVEVPTRDVASLLSKIGGGSRPVSLALLPRPSQGETSPTSSSPRGAIR